MTELDPQTKAWLQSLKINKTFSSLSDFENGYNFGFIFDKLQLSKGKKFKNSSDLGCIFQNYKNVRDLLLQNFNHDFPVNNIMYRTGDLLRVIRDQAIRYVEEKKIMTMKAATSMGSVGGERTLIQPLEEKQFRTREKEITGSATMFNQTSKMPKKIQDIQKKLDKFREEKTRHQLVALQERKQEIEQYRRVVMDSRDYEINKIKKIHEESKEKQRKVYDVWYKTEQIKKNRIDTDKQFESFQREKRNKLLQTLRKQQVETINKGQQMFELNCIRQGIELEHDPDKQPKPEGEFNKVVILERIKDNILKHEIDKKERIKRENKKRIDAEEAKIQSQAVWSEINKIEDYSKKFASHFVLCESTYKIQKRQQAQKETRKQKQKQKQFVDLPAYQDQQKRQQQFRKRKVQYLQNDVKWMENRWKRQYSIAEEVVEALLQITIEGEEMYNKNSGFVYGEWKNLENRFLSYHDTRKKKTKDTKLYMDYSSFDEYLKEYIKNEGTWKNYHQEAGSSQQQGCEILTKTVETLIDLTYPNKSAPITQKIPLYMPLKLTFYGPRLSGKSTHAAKLAQKYGMTLINPRQTIKEALDLAKPPVQQDPKKAAKKDSKKVQQMTPQKTALKQFGAKLLEKIGSVQEAKIQDYLSAIRFKINLNFQNKSAEEILNEFHAAKEKEKLRHQQALKDFEQAQKKPKKDSKKGAAEPAQEEPPKANPCFYSTGFVIDDLAITEQNIKILEKELNGFISEEERINQEALQTKKQIKLVIDIPEPIKDNTLKNGTFDLLFSLEAEDQTLIKRKAGRKMDPQTRLIYHQTFNPPPDVKGFAEKLVELPAVDDEQVKSSVQKYHSEKKRVREFYEAFGVESERISAFNQIFENQDIVQQTFQQLNSLIQRVLLCKYKEIEQKAASQAKEKSQLQEKNENIKSEEEKKTKQQSKSEQGDIKQAITTLKPQESKEVLNKFLQTIKKYLNNIKQCLYGLDSERNQFMKELLTVQKKFISLINRPDDKAGKILGFQENYNKLLSQRGNVVKDAEASRHLIQRLNELYDSLWDAIGSKKNEAVQQRLKFKDSNWLNSQSQRIVESLKTLLQIQLNYLCETIFAILALSCKLQGKSSDYVTQYLSLGIAPELEPISTVEKDLSDLTTNKRFSYYIEQTNKCLDSLPAWIQQKYKKMKIQKLPAVEQVLTEFVSHYTNKIKIKAHNIANKVNERVLQERSYFQTLINKMDDWIIQGIKSQNDFVYEIFKNIRKCIEEARKSNVKELHVRQITDVLYPIRELTLNPIPLRIKTLHRQLPIYSYMIFLEEIKTLANFEGYINFDIFKKYMEKRKKSELLHPNILKIDFDTTEQFLVKDGFLYLRQLAMAVILWDVQVFDDDRLAKYKQKLLKQQQSQQQKNYKNKQLLVPTQPQPELLQVGQNSPTVKKRLSVISAFPTEKRLKLNQMVLMEEAFDKEEEYIMKHLIFEIFRQNGADYVEAQALLDTLSFFDQIQAFRYGDTIMMLNL